MAIILLQAPLFALLICWIYAPLVAKSTDVVFLRLAPKLSGTHFLLVVAAIWFGCNNAVRDIVGEWTIYKRERMVSLKLPSYVLSKMAVAMLICVFQCIVMLAIVYLGCGLRGNFLLQLGVLLLSALVGVAIGLSLSAQAKTTESAIAFMPIILLPVIVLGGGLRPIFLLPKAVQVIATSTRHDGLLKRIWTRKQVQWPIPVNHAGGRIRPLAGVRPRGDVAEMSIPHYVVSKTASDSESRPGTQSDPAATAFRSSIWFCIGTLFLMLAILVASALTILRARDTHSLTIGLRDLIKSFPFINRVS